jgi:dCMP deaminase
MITKWDERFLKLAELVATWSKDPSTQVGAVIVDNQNRIVSTGFNGFPRGIFDDSEVTRDVKLMRTIHAETNALLFAQRDVSGMTIYVTHHPCANCAAKIIQSGITRVVVTKLDDNFDARWDGQITEALKMFNEAFVQVSHK